MSKRFIDTTIWEKEWFQELTPVEKCAFVFLFTKCDAVGVWTPNFKLANFLIGADVSWNDILEKSNGNIRVMDTGKWWLCDFIEFQYGTLKKECRPHQSYITLLEKHGLWVEYLKGIDTLCGKLKTHKDKDKEKEKEIELEKELEKEKEKEEERKGIVRVVNALNGETQSAYRSTGATAEIILSRMAEGYSADDLINVVVVKAEQWMGDEKMEKYLRPATLFGKQKFPGYLAEYQRWEKESRPHRAKE